MQQWVKDIPETEFVVSPPPTDFTRNYVLNVYHPATGVEYIGEYTTSACQYRDRNQAIHETKCMIERLGEFEYLHMKVSYDEGKVRDAKNKLTASIVRLKEYQARQNGRELAPWNDYKGNPIREGDTLVHPNGKTGTVVINESETFDVDRWLVEYENTSNALTALSRLCLQINNNNQGVVQA